MSFSSNSIGESLTAGTPVGAIGASAVVGTFDTGAVGISATGAATAVVGVGTTVDGTSITGAFSWGAGTSATGGLTVEKLIVLILLGLSLFWFWLCTFSG